MTEVRAAAAGPATGIIGGSGFIGTWLAQALHEAGHGVRIIDRQPLPEAAGTYRQVDVRDLEALTTACADCAVLYHLAAEHRDDVQPRSLYHEVNVVGTANVCAVAERHGIQTLVFTSTVAVYGLQAGEVDETAPPQPFNDYGRSKLEAERLLEAWAAKDPARSLVIVRPTVVFGPGNRGNVYLLLEQIAAGRAVVIGSGRNKKSLAYVANLADFLVHALQFGPGRHVMNYVDKPDIEMNGLVELAQQTLGQRGTRRIPYVLGVPAGALCDLVARLTGRRFPISTVRVRKYAASTQFAAARAHASGFVPRHPLNDALVRTIRHEFPTGRGAPEPAPSPS